MQGDRFAKQPPHPALRLRRLFISANPAGSASVSCGLCVQRMNRVRQRPHRLRPHTPRRLRSSAGFQEIAAHLRRAPTGRWRLPAPLGRTINPVRPISSSPRNGRNPPEALAFKEALGLDPSLHRFPLMPPVSPRSTTAHTPPPQIAAAPAFSPGCAFLLFTIGGSLSGGAGGRDCHDDPPVRRPTLRLGTGLTAISSASNAAQRLLPARI